MLHRESLECAALVGQEPLYKKTCLKNGTAHNVILSLAENDGPEDTN
jgi:hypothetical protein